MGCGKPEGGLFQIRRFAGAGALAPRRGPHPIRGFAPSSPATLEKRSGSGLGSSRSAAAVLFTVTLILSPQFRTENASVTIDISSSREKSLQLLQMRVTI